MPDLAKKEKPRCPKCGTEYRHMHNTAYDLIDTHMEGSERFECECGRLTREEAEQLGFRYILDTSKALRAS